jgi:MarC family membrane protein
MGIFSIAFALFLLMDAPGNIPMYLSILKHIPPARQRKIILREMLIALLIILIFAFLGQNFLNFLHISPYTIYISGGIILFLMAIKMVFSSSSLDQGPERLITEPFVVPLAIPLIAGPAVLTSVMLYAQQENVYLVLFSSTIAWFLSLIMLLSATYISKKIGQKGIIALERLMGLVLVLLSVEMFLEGLKIFFSK